MKTLVVLLSLGIPGILLAGGPGSAYIKNTGQDSVQIWVNGSYQGYVRPNETRYSVSDGFITNDSGNGHDGNPVNESHGGWHNNSSETITVTYQYADGEKKTVQVPANGRGDAALGVTDKDGAKPEPPTDEETEDAAAIIKGNRPNIPSTVEESEKPEQPTDRKENRKSERSENKAAPREPRAPFVGTWTGTEMFEGEPFSNRELQLRADGTATCRTSYLSGRNEYYDSLQWEIKGDQIAIWGAGFNLWVKIAKDVLIFGGDQGRLKKQ